jgi:GT2 family glycosyltransferase
MPEPCSGLIFTVVVLYDESAQHSRTVRSLEQGFAERPGLVPCFSILLYDNSWSPQPVSSGAFRPNFRIVQPGRNGGIAAAYNQALREAEGSGFPWLLLLDSDTLVTAAFLQAAVDAARSLSQDSNVAAVVPHVVEGGLTHSPRYIRGMRRRVVPAGWQGIYSSEIVALNSGALVRTQAVRSLGGFNEEFWLDYLDYWLFRMLQRRGYTVYVLAAQIEHSLSFADPAKRMPFERYKNMLAAERFFTARYGTLGERIRLKILLLKRAAILALKRNGMPYVRALLSSALRPGSPAEPPAAPGVPPIP